MMADKKTKSFEDMVIVVIAATQALAIFVLALIILAAIFGSIRDPNKRPTFTVDHQTGAIRLAEREEAMRRFVCFDEEVVNHLQRKLWLAAHWEVHGNTNLAMNDKDMGFYHEAYGALDVKLAGNAKNYSSIVYYRIYKVGNDNIRSLLFEHAFNQTDQMALFAAMGCPADRCQHEHVTRLDMGMLRDPSLPVFPADRFVFTFVRHPIVRFISAMNEIESRAVGNPRKTRSLPFQHEIGSVERVMDFIDLVLSTGGSGAPFRLLEDIELGHIAPMIGTLFLARSVERSNLQVYKLENFGGDWRRLSRHAAIPQLEGIFMHRKQGKNWLVHASASDPYNVTRAATSLLAIAGRDLFEK